MTYASVGQSELTQAGSKTFRTGLLGGLQDETTGTATTSYVRDPYGNLVGQRTSTGTLYYLFDGLGSVVGLTNSVGGVAQRFAYDPYGTLTSPAPTVDSAYRFAGGYFDTAINLYKFGERYYDSTTARWTQRDPLAG